MAMAMVMVATYCVLQVGYPGKDPGIVPLAMHEIFDIIEANQDSKVEYIVRASMLEIYNERVRCLCQRDNISSLIRLPSTFLIIV